MRGGGADNGLGFAILTPPPLLPPCWGGTKGGPLQGGVYINKILYYLRKKRPDYKIFILKSVHYHTKGLSWALVPVTIRLNHMKPPNSVDKKSQILAISCGSTPYKMSRWLRFPLAARCSQSHVCGCYKQMSE